MWGWRNPNELNVTYQERWGMKIKAKWDISTEEIQEKTASFSWEIKLKELDHLGYILQNCKGYISDWNDKNDVDQFSTKLRELYKLAKLKLLDNEVQVEIKVDPKPHK